MNNKVINISDNYKNSYIHPKAEIGKNVEIGPYSIIGPHVKIGDNTKIGTHVTITGDTFLGKANKIYHGVSIGSCPQGAKKEGQIFIGDNNIFREYVNIKSDSDRGNAETKIGNNNMIMAYCHISANCNISSDVIMSNATSVGEDVRIGRISMVGAHSNVLKDVPPYIIVDGHPAQVSGINVIGLRRNSIKPAVRREIKKAYKILYRSDLNIDEAIMEMDNTLNADQNIEYFLRFLRNVKRGICR